MTLSVAGTLLWHHPLADVALKSAAPIGAIFTALALISDSLWGRPTWGTWWEWDARLTSMFILLLIYLWISALSWAFEHAETSARIAAVLTIVGFINIPVIKFSVEWWNTLHQPASILHNGRPRPLPRTFCCPCWSWRQLLPLFSTHFILWRYAMRYCADALSRHSL